MTLKGGLEKRDEWPALLGGAGLVRGGDFVVTFSGNRDAVNDGVQGTIPSWLVVSLTPTGNPPELEARMEPEVRAMWERTRIREYSVFVG